MKQLIFLILSLIISVSTSAQYLTTKEIAKVREKKNWKSIDALLNSKGWVVEKPELLTDIQAHSISWNYAGATGMFRLTIERDWKDKSDITFTVPQKSASEFEDYISRELGYKNVLSLTLKTFFRHKTDLVLEYRPHDISKPVSFSFSLKDQQYWSMLYLNRKDPDVRSLDTYQIGDYLEDEGGILFYVSEGAEFGYILALTDANQGAGCEWGADDIDIQGSYPYTTTEWHEANFDMEGEANTKAVVSYLESNTYATNKYATQIAAGYDGGGHKDWYLPSEGQLRMLKEMVDRLNVRLRANGGVSLAKAWYWSSTEYDKQFAWAVNLGNMIVGRSAKKGMDRVRPVRTVRMRE